MKNTKCFSLAGKLSIITENKKGGEMSYRKLWNKILSEEETVEYEFSISSRYRNFWVILFGLLALPLVLIPKAGIILFSIVLVAIWSYYGFYLKKSNAYAFTNKRVLIHKGWLSTVTTSVDYSKITDVSVIEKFFERVLFGSGELVINTAGTANEEILLKHIAAPHDVKKELDEIHHPIVTRTNQK
jgi:uncharacterized membrane protein YdbT with pleckstrin-like domain